MVSLMNNRSFQDYDEDQSVPVQSSAVGSQSVRYDVDDLFLQVHDGSIKTHYVVFVKMFLLVTHLVIVILGCNGILPAPQFLEKKTFAFSIFLQVLLWCGMGLCSVVVHHLHVVHDHTGFRGFHRETASLKHAHMWVLSFGLVFMLVLAMMELASRLLFNVSSLIWVQTGTVAQLASSMLPILIYLVKVLKYNRNCRINHQSGVSDWLSDSSSQSEDENNHHVLRHSDNLESMVKKQSRLIRFLQLRNDRLGQKINELSRDFTSA